MIDALAFDKRVPAFLRWVAVQNQSDLTSYIPQTIYYSQSSYGDVEAAVSLKDAVIEEK